MKLPTNVKPKNWLINIFPFSRYTAQAIYPNIYFSRQVWENLKSDNPKHCYLAALRHEQTHIERQKQIGWIKWGLKYVFSSKFRFNEELIALKTLMKYLKQNKISFDTSNRAKHLSSWLYLWCVPYQEAKEELDKAWKET